MSNFLVTRGLGGNASSIMSLGFFGASALRLIKGGSRFVKKAVASIEENINISIMLISANGKELVKPIFNKVSRTFIQDEDPVIRLLPKTLTIRKAKDIKVSIDTLKVRNKKNERN